MSIVPYERQLEPPRIKSPFLRGITGPGFIGEPKSKPAEDDEPFKRVTRTDRPRRGNPTPPRMNFPLPSLVNGHNDQGAGPSRLPTQVSPAVTPTPSLAPPSAQQWSGDAHANRTITAMMGGPQLMDQIALREVLPQTTGEYARQTFPAIAHCTACLARLFERDANQQVLWFSGPSLAPGTVQIPAQPVHSLEYLEYLAKRKRGMTESVDMGRARGARHIGPSPGKDRRSNTKQEKGDISQEWWAQGMTTDQLVAGLRAVIESEAGD